MITDIYFSNSYTQLYSLVYVVQRESLKIVASLKCRINLKNYIILIFIKLNEKEYIKLL